MTFTKGNTLSVGKGRPPLLFSDEECDFLGQELVAAVKKSIADKDPMVHFTEWYAITKNFCYDDWDALRKRLCFIQYYKTAGDLMALSTQKNTTLSTAYGSRFLGVYSRDLKVHEEEISKRKIEHEQKVKAEALLKTVTSPNDTSLTDLISSIRALSKQEE